MLIFLKWQSSSQVIAVHVKKKEEGECQSPLRCTGQNRKTQAERLNEPLLAQGQWDRWPWGVHMGTSVCPKRIPSICVSTRRHILSACASVNLHNLLGHMRNHERRASRGFVGKWMKLKWLLDELWGPDVIVTAARTDPQQVWPYRRSVAKFTNVSRSVAVPQIWHVNPGHPLLSAVETDLIQCMHTHTR